MDETYVSSGSASLDEVVQGLRLGDNVVWQVDDVSDYAAFARRFAGRAAADGARCVYIRFAPHEPVLGPMPGLDVIEVDPGAGFDAFSSDIHRVIDWAGRKARHIFDNLSALAVEWSTDEQIANFFQFACPYLYELDTVAYFALARRRHDAKATARIRDTTQVLFDLFRVGSDLYVHPMKVAERYTPRMFLTHHVGADGSLTPITHSGDAAAISAGRSPLGAEPVSVAPWESVYQRLLRYRAEGIPEDSPEVAPLKQEFARMLLGAQFRIDELVDTYLTLDDLLGIRERLIGSGQIGGKAAGMILARRMLLHGESGAYFRDVLEGHDSFYIGSDVFYSFLVHNGLFRMRRQITRSEPLSEEAFQEVEQRFLAGTFSLEITEQFRNMLDYFGQAPVIVRSSSFLEDGFGNAFAGKYRSEFCANQGSPGERLEEFMRAVKLVYASTLNPDALSYRRKRGLIDRDEQMAILVQRVAGSYYKHYFFPSLAGVAHSRNLYAWTDRIDVKQGLVRLVLGLGTRAVNRVGGDYPRMFAISHPTLRPEFGEQERKYAQKRVDVIDLEANRFSTVSAGALLADGDYPELGLYASIWRDGGLHDIPLTTKGRNRERMVLAFKNLLERTDFVSILRQMLARLEAAYGHPVDTEFTASVGEGRRLRINLVQCRPLFAPAAFESVESIATVASEDILFRAGGSMHAGSVRSIRYILHIDPAAYLPLTVAQKRSIPYIVGRVNAFFGESEERGMMMGPGRWGSSSLDLGLGVGYAHINNARVLVEIARESAGMAPEFSYGTHFFQDLVEDEIVYLAVDPDDPAAAFNARFFESAHNILGEVVPEAVDVKPVVKLIDVVRTAGAYANVVSDPQAKQGICFLDSSPPD